MSGKFIVFEGGEGSGKSTQAKLLARQLSQQGIDTVETREPGGTPGAEAIRALLVDGSRDRWGPAAELGLFMAARADHVERVIKPALDKGSWVVCDRFLGSTLAYQGEAGGISITRILQAHAAIVGPVFPNLTIILDIDPEVGLRRKHDPAEAPSRFERQSLEFHHKVRSAYQDMARMVGYAYVNGDQDQSMIANDIWVGVSRGLLKQDVARSKG